MSCRHHDVKRHVEKNGKAKFSPRTLTVHRAAGPSHRYRARASVSRRENAPFQNVGKDAGRDHRAPAPPEIRPWRHRPPKSEGACRRPDSFTRQEAAASVKRLVPATFLGRASYRFHAAGVASPTFPGQATQGHCEDVARTSHIFPGRLLPDFACSRAIPFSPGASILDCTACNASCPGTGLPPDSFSLLKSMPFSERKNSFRLVKQRFKLISPCTLPIQLAPPGAHDDIPHFWACAQTFSDSRRPISP